MRFDILFIILAGAFLRLYRIQDFYMFLADQGRDAVIIRRIIELKKFPLIGPPSSIGEVFLGPFYYYIVAPFLFIFRSNPVGLAVGVAILSIAASVLIYYLVSKIVSRQSALFLSVLMATASLLVDVGRFSWNPNLLPYFAFITLALFFLSLHGKRRALYSVLFGLFFGLTFQLHHLAALLAVPVALYFLLFLARKKNISALLVPLLSAAGFLLTLIPFAVFEVRHDFLNIRNLTSLFTQQNVVSSGPLFSRLGEVASSVVRFALNVQLPSYIAIALVLALVGAVIALQMKRENPFITLILIAFVTLVYSLSRVNAQSIPHYYHTVYVSFFMLVAFVLDRLSGKKYVWAGAVCLLLFFALQVRSYSFLWAAPSRQYQTPERVGKKIAGMSAGERINLATYPVQFTSRDCYQYYIELYGGNVVDSTSSEVANSMYVLCDKEPCRILNSDSWNIQMFGKSKIDTIMRVDGVAVYKLIHN